MPKDQVWLKDNCVDSPDLSLVCQRCRSDCWRSGSGEPWSDYLSAHTDGGMSFTFIRTREPGGKQKRWTGRRKEQRPRTCAPHAAAETLTADPEEFLINVLPPTWTGLLLHIFNKTSLTCKLLH